MTKFYETDMASDPREMLTSELIVGAASLWRREAELNDDERAYLRRVEAEINERIPARPNP